MEKKTKTKKSSNFISFIKQLWGNPRGRGILFFAGYFIFFLALFLVLRFSTKGNVIGTGYEKGNPYTFSIANIVANNYQFHYQISIDGVTTQYIGQKKDDQELFSFQKETNLISYYRKADSYFTNNGTLWIKAENPYLMTPFLDIESISKILEKASYLSKTDYESGKQVYQFQIATATIVRLLEEQEIDIEEIPNDISLSTDGDGYVNKIQFVLDSYGKYQKLCSQSMKIVLEYSDYGKIEEIESPID